MISELKKFIEKNIGLLEDNRFEAVYDNLGKGASGAAIQNMNIMLGLEETTGLSVKY